MFMVTHIRICNQQFMISQFARLSKLQGNAPPPTKGLA